MKPFAFCLLLVVTTCGHVWAQQKKEVRYDFGPESKRQADVPRGTITGHEWNESTVFAGTKRRYSVYVPKQYDGSKPAALMVFQDGHAYVSDKADFRVPIVFDNLIHEGHMPITIGVFIDPGHKGDLPDKRGWRPPTIKPGS